MRTSPDLALPTTATRLATWVADLRFEDLEPDVVEAAKLLILDNLGVQLRGATLPNVQSVRRLVAALGGVPEASVTSGAMTSAPQAAYLNGTLGHSAEFDDAHMLAWHTGSAVVPAALAFAERERASGGELITAVVAGVQIMGLLGAVAGSGMLAAGWHGSKVLGVFGAAAATGSVVGLSGEQLAHAFGIAASDAGGTMEYDRSGGEVKRLHAGSAARAGAEAALLAQLGLTGPPTIFEGPRGIYRMFGSTDDASALDRQWERMQIVDTIFRFYPAVATTHSALDAVRRLREQHEIAWRDVDAIRVGLAAYAVGHGASITRPTDAISAQFSLAFGIGLQFLTDANVPQDYFDPARWADPHILAIADLVEPYAIEIPGGDPQLSARVEIVTRDGRHLEHYQRGFHGHPVWPATRADVEDKFRANLTGIANHERTETILRACAELDRAQTIKELTAALRATDAV